MSIKIGIGLPTNRQVRPKTVQSLLELVAHSKYDYHINISTRGYNTAENRNLIVAQAIKNNCTHLLLTDDDMVFEKDALDKLLAHDKDIVGAIYNTKYEKQELVIEYLSKDKFIKENLFKCKALGGGLLLIKTDVFLKVPQPHFGYKWTDNGMVEMSNDWFFCEKAREAGYDIWCDKSLLVGHIAEKVV